MALPAIATISSSSASGGLVLIENKTFADATSSSWAVTISAAYSAIFIVANIRGSAAATQVDLILQFNGDTGANYNFSLQVNQNTGAFYGGAAGTASPTIASFAGASSPANEYSGITIEIGEIQNTNRFKTALSRYVFRKVAGAADLYNGSSGLIWSNTARITSYLVKPSSGNFAANSQIVTYGLKAS